MNLNRNTDPLISIIMNCKNGEKYLKHSLNSITKQSYKNWELIFFDNCSTDKSKEILMDFRKKKKNKIKYFKSKKKLKLYHARNEAVKKAKGKYVCFLDTDDLWKKNKLLEQCNFMIKNNLSILCSNYIIYNMTNKKRYLRKKEKLPSGKITQMLLDDYFIGILTVMIKKNILENNKFNKKFEIIGDYDLFLKLSQKYSIFSINKPLAVYRFHKENISSSKIQLYIKEFKTWLKTNKKKFERYNLTKLKTTIFKLKVKKLLYS